MTGMEILLAARLLTSPPAYTPPTEEWNRPVAPFRIAGNVYYVGASEVSSYLIATDDGLVLLDSGFAETVPLIEASVRALGFRMQDVKVLLNSHAHFDHAGGLAALKRLTGARLHASAGDTPLLAAGGLGDHAFGDRFSYEPVTVDRTVKDGDVLSIGGTRLTAHVTPGHTPGCTTWTMRVKEDGRWSDVVFFCSLTAPGYRLVGNDATPGMVEDFRRSFRRVRALPCDYFLAPHGSQFHLTEKREALGTGKPNPFLDRKALARWVDEASRHFEAELAKQKAAEGRAEAEPRRR